MFHLKKSTANCQLFFLLLAWTTIPLFSQAEYSLEDALKVCAHIEKLQAAQLKEFSGPLREITVTEIGQGRRDEGTAA
jgi:hypothetical protein